MRLPHAFWPAVVASLVFSIAARATCRAETVMAVYSDGRPSEEIRTLTEDGRSWVAVSEVARLLGLEETLEPASKRVTLRDHVHSLEIAVGAEFWTRDGDNVTAGEAFWEEGAGICVSLTTVNAVIGQTFTRTLRWDPDKQRITVGLPAPNVIDLEVRSAEERVAATIKTIGLIPYELIPAVDGRMEILVKGGVFSKQMGFVADGGLIERVEVKQEREGTRFVFWLSPDRTSYRVFPQWSPDGIVVSVWRKLATEMPEPQFRPPVRLAWRERFTSERMRLDVVVVDPGHGGDNRGSIGPSGALEKDVNLAIARRVRRRLEAEGIKAILTRNDDVGVALDTRTEMANTVEADAMISIHANGFKRPEARGFEVYFVSPALDDESRVVAAMENAAAAAASILGYEERNKPEDDVAYILWDTAQNEFVVESSYLAQMVNEELTKALTIANRGVKQADFRVLKGAYLPAVLVETAFITNPTEEELLRDEAFQETVASAVVRAIMRFKEDYGR